MTRDLNLVVVLSAVAQVAAFLKSILIAYFFGVSPELDGYFLAQVVPAIVTGTAAGVLQSSFVPTYVQLKTEGRASEAGELAGRLMQVVMLVGAALASIVALFADQIVHASAPLAEPAVVVAATYSLRVLSLLLLLNALADFLALLLNAELRFAAAALAPTANAVVASVFLLIAPELGLANLVWGTLLGLAVQVLVLAYALLRRPVQVRFGHAGTVKHLRHVGLRSLAALPAVIIANFAANLPSLLAATLGAGAVSAFNYAWKLNLAATQAAGIAIGTVMLPHFSEMLARRDHASIHRALGRVIPLLFAIAGIALIWIWVAGEPFLRAAFQRGRFSKEDAQAVHHLWLVLAIGLAPSIASIALAKVIQAASSFALLAWFGLAGVVVVILISSILMPWRGIEGLAIANCASACTVFALCAIAVGKRLSAEAAGEIAPGLRPLLLIFGLTGSAIALVRLLPGIDGLSLLLVATLLAAAGSVSLVRSR